MVNKQITGECLSCESSYSVEYTQELVSEEYPEFCPFCGEPIEELTEEYIDDEDFDDLDNKWDD